MSSRRLRNVFIIVFMCICMLAHFKKIPNSTPVTNSSSLNLRINYRLGIDKIRGKETGILAYLTLPHVAKILDIVGHVLTITFHLGGKLRFDQKKKKKKFTFEFSRFFHLKIGNFYVLGGFWVFFFQAIQQTKFIQENVLIMIFRFCSKFCSHQHKNCKIFKFLRYGYLKILHFVATCSFSHAKHYGTVEFRISMNFVTKLDRSLPANAMNDRRIANAVTLKSTFCLP